VPQPFQASEIVVAFTAGAGADVLKQAAEGVSAPIPEFHVAGSERQETNAENGPGRIGYSHIEMGSSMSLLVRAIGNHNTEEKEWPRDARPHLSQS
jgi:hypothetical protein